MFSNPDIVSSLDLGRLVSRLDLTRWEGAGTRMAEYEDLYPGGWAGTRMAEYEDLYPGGWAGDEEAERRHREAVHKIIRWPVDEDNMVTIA